MYIESLFFLNFWIDFLILYATSILLKTKVKTFNIILSSFIGSFSVIILFLNIHELQALILKIYFSILMILFSFGYKNIKTLFINLFSFYFLNILLGGAFYLLKLENIYESILFLCILAPLIIYTYIKMIRLQKEKEELYYEIKIYIGKQTLNLIGFLDSGNHLKFKENLVIITNKKNTFRRKKYYIPYNTIGNYGLLECIKVDKVEMSNKTFKNVLLGFSDNFQMEDADVLLNSKMGG